MALPPSAPAAACRLAADRGLMVDLHCDETDDPLSRHIETLAAETIAFGLQGRVAGSHLTSMHSMDNYHVSKLIPLIAEAQVAAIANPLINITLQGRADTHPKRRGMTRVPELLAAGVTVAFGQDCLMDPWYPLGSGDMLDVAHMGLHVALMTRAEEMHRAFRMVTEAPAEIMGLDFGLRPGARASLVVLDCATPIEALRLRSVRRIVLSDGNIVSRGDSAIGRHSPTQHTARALIETCRSGRARAARRLSANGGGLSLAIDAATGCSLFWRTNRSSVCNPEHRHE